MNLYPLSFVNGVAQSPMTSWFERETVLDPDGDPIHIRVHGQLPTVQDMVTDGCWGSRWETGRGREGGGRREAECMGPGLNTRAVDWFARTGPPVVAVLLCD